MTGNPPQYDPDYNAGRYILKYRKPVLCNKLMKWARWQARANRRVRLSLFDHIRVSTVFLSVDHNYFNLLNGEIELFETMIFYNDDEIEDLIYARCSTWREALNNHKAAKNKLIKKGV